jgi:hypothetical protein
VSKVGIQQSIASALYRLQESLDTDRKKALYIILIEFGIMKLIKLMKMCLNEAYSRVWAGKHLSDIFPVKNGLK